MNENRTRPLLILLNKILTTNVLIITETASHANTLFQWIGKDAFPTDMENIKFNLQRLEIQAIGCKHFIRVLSIGQFMHAPDGYRAEVYFSLPTMSAIGAKAGQNNAQPLEELLTPAEIKVKRAAQVINEFCRNRNSQPETACIKCPIRDICYYKPH